MFERSKYRAGAAMCALTIVLSVVLIKLVLGDYVIEKNCPAGA